MSDDEEKVSSYEARIAFNTSNINSLTTNVRELAKVVDEQGKNTNEAINELTNQHAKSHKELVQMINNQAINQASYGKWNWQTFAAICGVIVACMTFILTVVIVVGSMALSPIEEDIKRLDNNFREQVKEMKADYIERINSMKGK